MRRYNPADIEPKWQRQWDDAKIYQATEDADRPKTYVTAMFPYPSGSGLHVGHVRNYSITDTIARFHRQRGQNVLTTIGWDAFGLPAENYAIKTGVPPQQSTARNIASFKTQLQRLGMSYDWSREITTTDPKYYRWTQWIFLQLFKHGLAYQKESLQWWCPVCKTVLANEQVINGRCWRHEDTPAEKKWLKQWFFRITKYADQLLDGIGDLEWPAKIKAMQRNWIGKSKGAEIDFTVADSSETIQVFTTRPDTLYGATFMVLAPEHPQVPRLTAAANKAEVASYIKAAQSKSDVERMETEREKTGTPLGSYAINPATGQKIPVWTADYVLMDYGTGAIMGVPAHDERDNQFATKFGLPIARVYDPVKGDSPYGGEGKVKNSGEYNGMATHQMRERIVADLSARGVAREKTNYRMRDWLISRQRYWGAPIPIIHCPKDGAVPVPEADLPVTLPEISDYLPDGSGTSALGRAKGWVSVTCPSCGGPAKRETDTMDGYACSSWYYLRYTDPHNNRLAWDPAKANYWMPIDYYCGGDHAVSHLLYSRFWMRFFADQGWIERTRQEPVHRLVFNGYIYAHDGQKMSKSKGNVVDPLELVEQGYGADALRLYELFIAPYELDVAWDPGGIAGTYRFLNRVWMLAQEYLSVKNKNGPAAKSGADPVSRARSKAVKKVTDDLERLSFNTAVAALMEYVNELYRLKASGMDGQAWPEAVKDLARLVAPFAPHIAEELWQQLGYEGSVHVAGWPAWDENLLAANTLVLAVQLNGRVRAEITLPATAGEADAKTAALNNAKIKRLLGGKQPARIIYVPGRLVSLVVKD
ncbi:MAG: leucine--tRNA ligase [Candidatus Chaera renei]|uniref:Leucine--tRNA ligase n=1 Tax=Candidatus Chaera renei TaxID=2506947 RepID=A0A4Q0ALI1_9BACT|nr:MAG: leucine--tRNA ligase [Candidatus Chaera renei]